MCRGCASGKATGTALPSPLLEEFAPMHLDTRLATLERQQALLQARHDIWEVIARCTRARDEQRQEEVAALVQDDVALQPHPWIHPPLVGKALPPRAFRTYRRTFQPPRHFITNHQLTIHADGTATGYANWFVV